MLNLKDIEHIGQKIIIKNASDISKINICGLVINETKNILVIRTKDDKQITVKKNEILKMEVMRDLK